MFPPLPGFGASISGASYRRYFRKRYRLPMLHSSAGEWLSTAPWQTQPDLEDALQHWVDFPLRRPSSARTTRSAGSLFLSLELYNLHVVAERLLEFSLSPLELNSCLYIIQSIFRRLLLA